MLNTYLGDSYVRNLFEKYSQDVPREADLVCYWFHKATVALKAKAAERVGLVSTNSIRGGANRQVLDAVRSFGQIFNAWDDEAWVLDGAAVRVSLVCFSDFDQNVRPSLNGCPVLEIYSDLIAKKTADGIDLTTSASLNQNRHVAFMGDTKGGAFDVGGETARSWLMAPINPNGRPNSDVLRPWRNGNDITSRSADKWIIDFGWKMPKVEASLYEAPFRHVQEFVHPSRIKNRRDAYARFWWRHVEPRQTLRNSLAELDRFILTPRVSKHRLFVYAAAQIIPDSATIAIIRSDDTAFGILHSRFHELWSLRMCTWLGVGNDPRYTPTTCFETFPFPEGLSPNIPAADYASDPRAAAIAMAARRLNDLRENWLNPADLIKRVPEAVPGYPDRVLPINEKSAAILKRRTLTNLYNERPAWLDHAHRALDEAVAAAYGWPADLAGEQILECLFQLNQERAKAQASE